MSGVFKAIGKILPIALGIAAVVFTAGAAIPAIGAIVGAGGLSGAIGSVLGSVGIDATSTLGGVLAGAAVGAADGSAIGMAGAALTGGNIADGAASGMTTGAMTGGVMGGIGSLADTTTGVATAAPDIAAPTAPDATMPTYDVAASDGAAGDAGLTGATVTTQPVTSGALPGVAQAGSATNGTGGLLTQVQPGVTPVAPSSASIGAAGTTGTASPDDFSDNQAATGYSGGTTVGSVNGATSGAPATSGNVPNVSVPGNTYTGADGVTYVSNGATWSPQSGGGLMSSLFGKSGMLSNGGLGSVIGGVGGALVQGQTAADQAKAQMNMQTQQQGYIGGNYGGSSASVPPVPAASQPSNLQSPTQAFNPNARWVYDPTQKRLVLTAPQQTPAAPQASAPATPTVAPSFIS